MKLLFCGDSLTAGSPGVGYLDVFRARCPGHALTVCARGGDTALSLLWRVRRARLDGDYDAAFVWVGVNEVFSVLHWTFPFYKLLAGQPWAPTRGVFRRAYRDLLAHLGTRARRVFAVAPMLLGEDPANRWNRRLEVLDREIRALAAAGPSAAYVDLRARLVAALDGRPLSPYLPVSGMQIARDVWELTTPALVDARARERGLHLTLDGVHLNSAGAALAAETFAAFLGL